MRKATAEPGNIIPDGQRNSTLTSHAGTMRRVGCSESEILALLLQMNSERCCPPMDASEVEAIARSNAKYEPDQLATAAAEGWSQQFSEVARRELDQFADPGPFPAHLLNVPGFIENVVAYRRITL